MTHTVISYGPWGNLTKSNSGTGTHVTPSSWGWALLTSRGTPVPPTQTSFRPSFLFPSLATGPIHLSPGLTTQPLSPASLGSCAMLPSSLPAAMLFLQGHQALKEFEHCSNWNLGASSDPCSLIVYFRSPSHCMDQVLVVMPGEKSLILAVASLAVLLCLLSSNCATCAGLHTKRPALTQTPPAITIQRC